MIELTIKEKELIRDIIWDFLNDKLKHENYKNRINELNDIMTKLTNSVIVCGNPIVEEIIKI